MYANRKPPGKPPCETCRVVLMAENEDAAGVYMSCRRQYVTAEQGRVVDISIPAIKIVMDLQGVRGQRDCMRKVRNLFYRIEDERRE
jgi:hypothetical protein